ncbi:hypothetical protein IT575_12270 [bacterium]|nr:hypothetical protein [bacterium]
MLKHPALFFVTGLLVGIVFTWGLCTALLQHERAEHAAAIRELLDCDTTTGWMQGLGPDGGLVWLPVTR